jgi:uncharacterized protein
MRWDDLRRSSNVEDYRGTSFGGPGLKLGVGGTLVVAAVAYFFGVDPSVILGLADSGSSQTVPQTQSGTPTDEQGQFISAVLGETEDTWSAIFEQRGAHYSPPKLVLFSRAIPSACGFANSAAGPFYCPEDRKVYLDMAFFQQLAQEFQAPGQFAQAYVLAHEVGHHVQTLLGIEAQVRARQERASEAEVNQLQVRMELQADCFAGVWARHADETHHILEQGDVESALRAAAAVGDDTLQKRTKGYVVPESFTHGTAAQRTSWFQRGLTGATIASCDTFGSFGTI